MVRHEFGHALGHDPRAPEPGRAGPDPWDKPKVYAYYAQQGWRKADVDFNIFQVYAEDSTNHTAFDPTSIMEYAIPDSLTIGSYAIGWNTEFSAPTSSSCAASTRRTPRRDRSSPSAAAAHAGRPRRGGEVDTYHFDVPRAATLHHDHRGPDRHRADAARARTTPARCSPGTTTVAAARTRASCASCCPANIGSRCGTRTRPHRAVHHRRQEARLAEWGFERLRAPRSARKNRVAERRRIPPARR